MCQFANKIIRQWENDRGGSYSIGALIGYKIDRCLKIDY